MVVGWVKMEEYGNLRYFTPFCLHWRILPQKIVALHGKYVSGLDFLVNCTYNNLYSTQSTSTFLPQNEHEKVLYPD